MALHGFLVELHPSPHEGVRVRLVSPRDRVVVATFVPCRSWSTLRADSTTSRRRALFVVAVQRSGLA